PPQTRCRLGRYRSRQCYARTLHAGTATAWQRHGSGEMGSRRCHVCVGASVARRHEEARREKPSPTGRASRADAYFLGFAAILAFITASLSSLPGVNFTRLRAGTVIFWRVCGLTRTLSAVSLTPKTPKPTRRTVSPCSKEPLIESRVALTISVASF